MADVKYTEDQVIAAETAIEVLNSAQAILSEKLERSASSDLFLAGQIEAKARELYGLQQSIRVADNAAVEDIIATWGPRVRDEQRFWRELWAR